MRRPTLIILALIACLVLISFPVPVAGQVQDTGFSVSNPKFADYYQHRGGARVLGFPISRELDFLGTRVQFFQRAVLQLQPDGGVGLLNILDTGLLPYTQINGSTFPAVDSSIAGAAPSAADPNYATSAIDFVRAFAPDNWEGLPTNFFSAFTNTVSLQEAFPNGGADPSLLPLISLEIWGLPISRPAYDPNNGNFVYLRFQRGIMHFDKTSGVTQGILIGDYLKSVVTGQNLPADLAAQAQGSKLLRQYDNNSVGGMVRPADLPGTNLFAAFEKDGVVVPPPQPTATPVPATPVPAATATPVPPSQPAAIAVTGSSWFVEQTNLALNMLATKGTLEYSRVRQYVYRIDETTDASSYDVANRALKVTEANALPPDFRSYRDVQLEWYAGLMIHNATHIEQAVSSRPNTGYDAEQEARVRQRDFLCRVDTSQNPGGLLCNYLNDVVDGKLFTWGDWEQPRPGPTATPTL